MTQRAKIDSSVRDYVDLVIKGERPDVAEFAKERFKGLQQIDAVVAEEALATSIQFLSPVTAPLYGIKRDRFEAYEAALSALKHG